MRRPLLRLAGLVAGLVAGLLVAVTGLGLLGLPGAPASAAKPHSGCSAPRQPLVQAVQTADAVFAGKVSSVRKGVATVMVGTTVKGTPGTHTSVRFSGDCRVVLKPKQTYAFFVRGTAGAYVAAADLPTSDKNVDKTIAEAKQLLAPPAPTVSFSSPLVGRPLSFLRLAAPGIAAVVIGLAGLLLVRLRRA